MLPSASPFAPCSLTTAPATDPLRFDRLASTCSSNITAPDLTPPEPTERPSDLSRPPSESGPTQNTGSTQTKEMKISNLGPTTTTTKDLMVVSTTSRPSAAPAMEQRLDHLQAPASPLNIFSQFLSQ